MTKKWEQKLQTHKLVNDVKILDSKFLVVMEQ